jgi:predicted MFS family arabinose efflux permease
LLLTTLVWRRWPDDAPLPRAGGAARQAPDWPILAVALVYALFALGLVPHMVFLVDFVARGLGWGIAAGALFWVVYGLGAIAGPFVAGWLGDRLGFARGLSIALALQLLGVLIPLLTPIALPLALSALLMGAFTPGMPTLVLGRVGELSRGRDPHAAWAFATIAYALTQAGGAYFMSWLYARTAGYDALFLAGAVALFVALALSLMADRGRTAQT